MEFVCFTGSETAIRLAFSVAINPNTSTACFKRLTSLMLVSVPSERRDEAFFSPAEFHHPRKLGRERDGIAFQIYHSLTLPP